MNMKINKQLLTSVSVVAALLLAGCDSNKNPAAEMPTATPPLVVTTTDFSYEVMVTNLTSNQPLSPITVVSHEDITLWSVGFSASDALELLAESGDNSEIIADTRLLNTIAGGSPLPPGMTESLLITTTSEEAPLLSILSMLVNTNDAFSGRTAIDVSGLAIGADMSMVTRSYDSGTEANSEAAGSIPGPADSGEGFNSARDDVDYVAGHAGVVSRDDGLTTSVLSASHKFDNPVMKVTIRRMQ
jgi:hypothetical protein